MALTDDTAAALAKQWLHVLDSHMAAMPTKWKNDIQGFVTNAPTSSSSASAAMLAMSILTDNDPTLHVSLSAHIPSWAARQCFIAPLLIWAHAQPWAVQVDSAKTIDKWSRLKRPERHSENIQFQNTVLQLTRALRPFGSSPQHEKMADQLLSIAINTVDFNRPHCLTPEAAQLVVNAFCLADESSKHRVNQMLAIVHTALDNLSGAEKDITARNDLLTSLAQSPMRLETKIQILQKEPVSWRLVQVQQAIEPQWELSEDLRFDFLPLLQSDAEPVVKEYMAKENRRIVKAYCPKMYPLLELSVHPDAWTNQTLLRTAVSQFTAQSPELFDITGDAFIY